MYEGLVFKTLRQGFKEKQPILICNPQSSTGM
uniref:Uncharacterized protein n=1 Tax=Arundo donax TaxID=35708 RepID=A0A0A9C0L9_ARUDO